MCLILTITIVTHFKLLLVDDMLMDQVKLFELVLGDFLIRNSTFFCDLPSFRLIISASSNQIWHTLARHDGVMRIFLAEIWSLFNMALLCDYDFLRLRLQHRSALGKLSVPMRVNVVTALLRKYQAIINLNLIWTLPRNHNSTLINLYQLLRTGTRFFLSLFLFWLVCHIFKNSIKY